MCKQQDFSSDERQNLGVHNPIHDHRKVLRDNLAAWMAHRNFTRQTLKAIYLDGPKKGKKISPRSIGNILSEKDTANSPAYDMIVAIAARLEIMPWQLLVPGRGPANPPCLAVTPAEAKLHREFERLRAELGNIPR